MPADLIERYVPALSATSDMPDVMVSAPEQGPAPNATSDMPDSAPAVAEDKGVSADTNDQKALADPPADTDAQQTTEAVAESEPTVEAEPVQEAKEPSGVGKALEAQRALIREAQERAAAAERRAAEAIQAMEALAARIPEPKAVEEPADPRPVRETYDTPDAYDVALTDWSGRQAARAIKAELAAQAIKEREAAAKKAADDAAFLAQQEAELVWNDRKAKAIEKHPDFDAVTGAADLPINQIMADIIKRSEMGPDIAYHLGKNHDEARRIAGLEPWQQISELAILGHTLKTPKQVVTKAPAPIKPIRPSSTPANQRDLADMGMEEYAAKRNEAIRASARRPGAAIH